MLVCLALSNLDLIKALVKFIYNFVKHLTTAKLSILHKTFHVTSRLAKRILTEMYEPDQGIFKSFKPGILHFWATIWLLDLGLGFKRTGLENLHIVSSELVKFLLVNTGHESISELEAKVSLLEGQASDLHKIAKNSEKSIVTAFNKSDEIKKMCKMLLKSKPPS
jgi:hypothetical protein